jgi:predicted O-linked N-acetylglucosamine transferase (SPINDLY family)
VSKGQLSEAADACREAIRLKPGFAEAYYNLGIVMKSAGRLHEAIAAYREAIRLKPKSAEVHNNLGNVLKDAGRIDEAISTYEEALRVNPSHASAHNNLGVALTGKGQGLKAIAAYQRAIELKPDYADAHYNLGLALQHAGHTGEAIASYRRAIQFNPRCAVAYNNIGNMLVRIGQIDEALASYREAVRIEPGFVEAHSNLIFTCHYHPGYDSRMIRQELRRWNQQHADPLRKFIRPHDNNRDPQRRLRVGYVSPDFRANVVGQHLLPLLQEHDHGEVEIFCYSNCIRGDELTEKIRHHANAWRDIAELSDLQVAELIRQDQIDILMDLALHTANNRLKVFAHKPAPVQVTYLAYCSTTGLDAMDYRLTDPDLDPSGSDDGYYSEKSIWLPETYWCYPSRTESPEVGPLPSLEDDSVTFACLNNFAKVSPPAMELWAEILRSIAGSRLILHCYSGAHLDVIRDRFSRNGIEADRIEFIGIQSWLEYARTYGRIDIALDPFPWGGGITTCDALWMGVPVVTLIGQTAVGRGGVSILRKIGLPELIAKTPEQYVRIAVALAGDLPRRTELRRTLRARMQASPLMNAPRFARHVETAYREIWRIWCAQTEHSNLQHGAG